ncbi:hypothetical protein N8I77_005031 [Diaporthe amygdali]|uniref:Helicase ATP-binding domain-containing protein n=1 Tax=Phomopsis amygdali TaxID=1214568 RepID=A0AAD9SNB2_PHOAM|nr:hypothetical protein N8I77_005031 [Diaporthe amygdali]
MTGAYGEPSPKRRRLAAGQNAAQQHSSSCSDTNGFVQQCLPGHRPSSFFPSPSTPFAGQTTRFQFQQTTDSASWPHTFATEPASYGSFAAPQLWGRAPNTQDQADGVWMPYFAPIHVPYPDHVWHNPTTILPMLNPFNSQGFPPMPIQNNAAIPMEIATTPYANAPVTYHESPSPECKYEIVPSDGVAKSCLETKDTNPVEDIVCFGTIPRINTKCHRSGRSGFPKNFAVELVSWDRFSSTEREFGVRGRIPPENGQMIQGLLEEPTVELEVSCSIDGPNTSASSDRSITQVSCSLAITVYGPFGLFDDIGTWLQDYRVHLQDPVDVERQGVKYCNPHRLSVEDINSCPLVSTCVFQNSKLSRLQEIENRPDFLDILSSHADLEEASQPKAVRTSLQKHQRQALTFMLNREKGWIFDKDGDIWMVRETHAGLQFINKVSGTVHFEEPPVFRGGIVADPMGLGKTLTMIALAATDLESAQHGEFPMIERSIENRDNGVTLIIVPPPLLGTWQEQLFEHLFEGKMSLRLHYGKEKLVDPKDLEGVAIVLTTYHTVSADFKSKGRDKVSSVLFSTQWRRVVLDEAHFIRNENRQMSRAICDLQSSVRWAVTGTPIQNHLDDLSALLKFIRAYPYHQPKQFKADISTPWKLGEEEKAINRLKYLSASLVLRRPKTTISLPPRRDSQCPIEFSPEERKAYQEVRNRAITKIEEALQPSPNTSCGTSYVNVLQQIESLRLICNLGLNYRSRHDNDEKRPREDWTSMAQSTFNTRRELDPISCLHCSSDIGLAESLLDFADGKREGRFFRCLKFCCGECVQKLFRLRQEVTCGHRPPCPGATVSLESKAIEVSGSLETARLETGVELPSKLQALVTDIKSLPITTKCVVFSTWRLTLDLVEAGLNQHSIANVRFDGKVPQKERQNVVDRFKNDQDTRVMLLTLSCGAVGNPTLEEQALARIHRIGQTKEVSTIRFYIRDSFEEQVMKLQTKKKQLAGLLLAPHDGGDADENLGGLHNLRSLL